MNQKQSTDSLFYKITQYIYYFLLVNGYFLISNLLIITLLLYLPISLSNLLIYVIGLLPTGASLTALFYTMGKLYREKTINPTQDYWRAYKKNFLESSKYWLILLIAITVLIVDILFVLNRGWMILTVISLLLFAIVMLSGIYAFSLLARFEVSIKNVIIFSILLIYQNKLKSASLLSLLIAFALILYGFFTYAVLFIFAIAAYYFMRNNHPILDKMEATYSQQGGEEE